MSAMTTKPGSNPSDERFLHIAAGGEILTHFRKPQRRTPRERFGEVNRFSKRLIEFWQAWEAAKAQQACAP